MWLLWWYLSSQHEYDAFNTLWSKSFPFPTSSKVRLHRSSNPIAVCNGSVQSTDLAFDWVLTTSNPRCTLLRWSDPAYSAYMDSCHAEDYEILSTTSFLHLLERSSNVPSLLLTIDVTTSQSSWLWISSFQDVIRNSPSKLSGPFGDLFRPFAGTFRLHPNLGQFPFDQRPEIDVTLGLDEDESSCYHSQFGAFYWIVELGCFDMSPEVSCLASHLP
jgi:hypothetical protein